ncbi:MAG TPA: DMT family transporter [Bacteroidales bacterium]|nr:DMT family transporter [Bacteroidales bacterium]HRX98356.1 DMT family transporter [Bacteroidales bacterium]
MLQKQATHGYIWAFVAVLAMSNVYIFSKAALNEVHLVQFGFYWFLFGLTWNLVFALKTCKLSTFRNLQKKQLIILMLIGILEISGTTIFFTGISTIENPSVASFLANMTPVFVTILGVFVLSERFNRIEVLGMILTVGGAFIISYRGSQSMQQLFLPGSEFIVASSLIFAFSTIVVKKNVLKLPPALLSLNRVIFLFIFSLAMLPVFNQSLHVSTSALINMGIGSVLGPFLAVLASYNALRYIEAARASILGSSKGLFVLVGAYLYFNNIPEKIQIIGGIITIAGVLMVTFGKMKLNRKKVGK